MDFNLFATDSLCCCVDKRAIDAVQATSFCHTLASSLDPTDASNLGARPKMITSGSHGDLPRGFLNHVDEEGGVWVVLQLLEVPKHFVVGCGAKYSLKKRGEFSKHVRLDVKKEVTLLLSLLSVVQNYLPSFSVLVDSFCHHFVDGTVVVDVLVGRFSMLEDVVVISVVDDQDTTRFQHVKEILDGNLLIPQISMVIHKIREGVAHADDCIKATSRNGNILLEGHPVPLLNHPVEERFLSSPVPPGFQRVLQHLVREVAGGEVEGGVAAHLLDQHDGVDPSAAGRIHDGRAVLLLQQVDQEGLVVGRPAGLLSDVESPVLGRLPVGILVLHS